MAKFDLQKIRDENPLDAAARKAGVKLIKDGREWRALCPLHKEDTPSFTIFKHRQGHQIFHCHGCHETGDVIDFTQAVYRCDFVSACEILGGKKDAPERIEPRAAAADAPDPYAGFVILKVPTDAPTIVAGKKSPPILNPKRADDPNKRAVSYTPSLVHQYTDADGRPIGYVLRIDIGDGKKITPTILWAKNTETGYRGWIHGAMPEPRPPYGVADLKANPDLQVLIVEGEKCRDAAAAAFAGKLVAISWCGGGKASGKTLWDHLAGRRVVIWPDNDPEGEAAALGWADAQGEWRKGLIEHLLAARVSEIKVIRRPGDEKPKGWDVADALQKDKMTPAAILKWAKDRAEFFGIDQLAARKRALIPSDTATRDIRTPSPVAEAIKPETQVKPEPTRPSGGGKAAAAARPQAGNVVSLHGDPIPEYRVDDDWKFNLQKDDDGKPLKRLNENFKWMLRGHPAIAGTFAFNEMFQEIFVVKRPPWNRKSGEWVARKINDDDIIETVGWLERQRLTPHAKQAAEAIAIVSKDRAYHPVKHYLSSLRWDSVPRLRGGRWEGERVEPFTSEFFGIPADENGGAAAVFFMRWMISAVARIMRPGCKADCMIVLESDQGRRKSTFLEAMATIDGVKYFTDAVHDIENKDAALQLQGVWIAEIAELHSFRRKEADAVKAWLSRNTDRFRRPYGRTVDDYPRQSVIAGTMNPSGHGYLRDPTGARRFWPLPIRTPIDIDRIAGERHQLWAEAVAYYRAFAETGDERNQWWLTEKEVAHAKAYTDERYEVDPWSFEIDAVVQQRPQVSLKEIMDHMSVPIAQRNGLTIKRISEYLKKQGWTKARRRTDLYSGPTNVWLNPNPRFAETNRKAFGDDEEMM